MTQREHSPTAISQSYVELLSQTGFTPGVLAKPESLAATAAIFGFEELGVADLHHLEAWAPFETACVKQGIKPVFGEQLEMKIRDNTIGRLSLHVVEPAGFKSLFQLNQVAPKQLTIDALRPNLTGLVVIAPQHSYAALQDVVDPHRLFLELTHFGDQAADRQLASDHQFADQINAEVVATNHVWRQAYQDYDQLVSLVLVARSRNKQLSLADFAQISFRHNRQTYEWILTHTQTPLNMAAAAFHPEGWLKPPQMMRKMVKSDDANFPIWQRALATSHHIAKQVEPDKLPTAALPKYPVSEGDTAYSVVLERSLAGAKERFGAIDPAVMRRLTDELQTIGERDLADYFLIVHDVISYASDRAMVMGVGSATCSLVCYCLGITAVNPLDHGLPFERFLSSASRRFPDIDTQIDADYVADVRDYAINHFAGKGLDVARLGTFPTYGAQAALSAVLKAFGITSQQITISDVALSLQERSPRNTGPIIVRPKSAPRKLRKNRPVLSDKSAALVENGGVSTTPNKPSPTPVEIPYVLVRAAMHLASLNPHQGYVAYHPSKVIVAPGNFSETHVVVSGKDRRLLAVSKDDAERRQELCLDWLSSNRLNFLSALLSDTATAIKEIPVEDKQTLLELFHANTIGIPDIESPWMRQMLWEYGQKIQWLGLEKLDLRNAFGASRPGLTHQDRELYYARRQQGGYQTGIIALDGILADTYGVVLFQEQFMRIASEVAGFSPDESDLLRRQVSKEKSAAKLMATAEQMQSRLITAGLAEDDAQQIATQLINFSRYGFVKGHAITLMDIAYYIGYFKFHYPEIFYSLLLQRKTGYYHRIGQKHVYREEAARRKIKLPKK